MVWAPRGQSDREVEQMFAELETLRGASTDEARARRKALAEQVTIELVRHSIAEEVLVYPEVEDKVSAEAAEHAREEHAEAEETLQRLEKLDADDPAFDDALATLIGEICHHIDDEEGRDVRAHAPVHRRRRAAEAGLPRRGLQGGCADPAAPECAERSDPTDAAGPAASLFDRMRDLATSRGTAG